MEKLALTLAVVVSLGLFAGCNDVGLGQNGQGWDPSGVEVRSNAVDVLWVIDNSGSMLQEQEALADRFDEFIDDLAAATDDFHIAVITTDTSNRDAGVFRSGPHASADAEIVASCPDAVGPVLDAADYYVEAGNPESGIDTVALQADFRCIAAVGRQGAVFEAGLQAVQIALSDELLDSQNAGFLRDDAALSVMFLTDEDDCSHGAGFTPFSDSDCYVEDNRDQLIPVQDVYDQLVELKGGAANVYVAGIIGPDDMREFNPDQPISCISELGEARSGDRYAELISMFEGNGVEASICADDFGATLRTVAAVLTDNLDAGICVPQEPATCSSDADCALGACVNPGNPSVGDSFCETYEVEVTVIDASMSELLAGPGAISEMPSPDRVYDVDYDASDCGTGVRIDFVESYRPPAGSRVRLFYEIALDW